MSKENILQRGSIAVFIINDGTPKYLHLSSVEKLFYKGDNGRLILRTVGLEEINFIEKLNDGFSIDIRATPIGRLDDPINGSSIVKLNNCQVVQNWVDKLSIYDPNDYGFLTAYAYIKGEIITDWLKGSYE